MVTSLAIQIMKQIKKFSYIMSPEYDGLAKGIIATKKKSRTPAYFGETNVYVDWAVKILIRIYDVTMQASTGSRMLTLVALRSFARTNATMLKPNNCDVWVSQTSIILDDPLYVNIGSKVRFLSTWKLFCKVTWLVCCEQKNVASIQCTNGIVTNLRF